MNKSLQPTSKKFETITLYRNKNLKRNRCNHNKFLPFQMQGNKYYSDIESTIRYR